eukprot:5185480-Pleurochrysis_carterae.AAC.3
MKRTQTLRGWGAPRARASARRANLEGQDFRCVTKGCCRKGEHHAETRHYKHQKTTMLAGQATWPVSLRAAAKCEKE